ncbi:MAG TPA: exosortase/archaeosortase family protein [Desulfobacteraceae bacterium]|nr:exosortase/archaeosortase family protein [Desulfobacteraceae bacterium]
MEPKHSAGLIKSVSLFLLWFVLFIPVYPSLIYTWLNNSNDSHGILVPLISAYLVWQKRDDLQKTPVSVNGWGVVILCVSLIFYILSFAGAAAVVSRAMIVFSLIGLVIFNFGSAIFSLIKFPLFYLLFMIPVPVSIYGIVAFPLQLFATRVSELLLHLVSIPVYREGNMLYFAQTQLEVAEACSGLRSMTAFIMLSFLFAYMMKTRCWPRITIVLSAIPLALFANILRVTGTGILAHFYGSRVARGFLHEFSGLAVFAFGFVLLFVEYLLLNRAESKR